MTDPETLQALAEQLARANERIAEAEADAAALRARIERGQRDPALRGKYTQDFLAWALSGGSVKGKEKNEIRD